MYRYFSYNFQEIRTSNVNFAVNLLKLKATQVKQER